MSRVTGDLTGTNILDLMKEDVEPPSELVDMQTRLGQSRLRTHQCCRLTMFDNTSQP